MSNGTGRVTNEQLFDKMSEFAGVQITIQGDVAHIKKEVSKLNGRIEKNNDRISENKNEIVGHSTALEFMQKDQNRVEKKTGLIESRLWGIIKEGIMPTSVVLLILQEFGKANGWW